MDNASYKKAQEAFVSNHNGTTMAEIILVTIPLPIALFAYAEFKAYRQVVGRPPPTLIPALFYEFFFLILPQVLPQLYPEWAWLLVLSLLLLARFFRSRTHAHTHSPKRRPSNPPPTKARSPRDTHPAAAAPSPIDEPPSSSSTSFFSSSLSGLDDRLSLLTGSRRRNFVTNYRAGVMLTSAIAILAVDFPLFPRRFAKTEAFGTGLMDLGVGSFMFANGLSSRFARGGPLPLQARASGSTDRHRAPLEAMRLMRQVLPLLVLGGGRLATHFFIDYQRHVSEYGVHWNFFLTLAAVHVLSTALHATLPPKALLPLSLAAMVVYQINLSLTSLSSFVLDAPRDPSSLYSMNREGLLGITAYLFLDLLGEQVGVWFLWPPLAPSSRPSPPPRAHSLLLRLLCTTLLLWLAALSSSHLLLQAVSRRLCNLPYVLWAAAHNVLVLLLLLAVDLFASIPAKSQILCAMNRNQLFFFVLANLMTGAVNLAMHTIYAPPSQTLTILLGYTFSLCLVFLLLDKVFNVTLKFW